MTYSEPMRVVAGRPLWIVGPGTLDATLEGEVGAAVHLDKCTLVNRTTKSVASNGLTYVFGKGVYLNFPNLRRNENLGHLAYMENLDGADSAVTFEGPETVREWQRQRAAEIRANLEKGIVRLTPLYEKLHIGHTTLSAAFREVGIGSPAAFIRQEQFRRVKRLLTDTQKPIAEIARETGFISQTHFANFIKRYAGMTASALRRSGKFHAEL